MKLKRNAKSVVSELLVLSLLLLLIPLVAHLYGEDKATPPPSVPSQVAAEQKTPPPSPKPSQLATDLIGTWILAGAPDNVEEPSVAGARLKFITGKHWTVTKADPDTGEVEFHLGGTYTLEGDEYVETVKYSMENNKDLISKVHKFKVKVEGDTLTQIGVDNPWTEVWKRAK